MSDNERSTQVRSVTERLVGSVRTQDFQRQLKDRRSVHIIDNTNTKHVGNYIAQAADINSRNRNERMQGATDSVMLHHGLQRDRHGLSANGHRIMKNAQR